jgi:hypothetical protein
MFADLPAPGARCSHFAANAAHRRGMTTTTVDLRTADCGCDHEHAAADPERRISTHRTSLGHVIYYRCDCGVARIALRRWRPRFRQAA